MTLIEDIKAKCENDDPITVSKIINIIKKREPTAKQLKELIFKYHGDEFYSKKESEIRVLNFIDCEAIIEELNK